MPPGRIENVYHFNKYEKSKLLLLALLSSSGFLTACGNSLRPSTIRPTQPAPAALQNTPAKPRSCDAQSVTEGMEINTYLFPTPDLDRDPTEENKNQMSNLHQTCNIISNLLVGNIFGLSPTGKKVDYETGRIDILHTYESICKDREPTSYLKARGKDQVPLRWVERGIWLSALYLLANIKEHGLREKNELIFKT